MYRASRGSVNACIGNGCQEKQHFALLRPHHLGIRRASLRRCGRIFTMTGALGVGNDLLHRIIVEDDADNEKLRLITTIIAILEVLDTSGRLEVDSRHITNKDSGVINDNILPRTAPEESRIHCNWLLNAPEIMFKDLFRMPKAVFFDLYRWL